MKDDTLKIEPIPTIVPEDGAKELAASSEMRPYLELASAVLSDDPNAEKHLKTIAELPLEKRYVWRVASALKLAFADYDSANVVVDRGTLEDDELRRLGDLLRLRPIQFCLFLKSLVGPEEMERMIFQAVTAARDNESVWPPTTDIV